MITEPLTELDQADAVIRRLSDELRAARLKIVTLRDWVELLIAADPVNGWHIPEQVKLYLAYLGVDKSYYARKANQ